MSASWRINCYIKAIIWLSGFIFWGSILYYLANFSLINVFLAVLLTSLSTYLINKQNQFKFNTDEPQKITRIELVLILALGCLVAGLLAILIAAKTDLALRSPFEVIPRRFFAIFLTTILILIGLASKNKLQKFDLIFALVLVGLSTTVAAIIYQVGFGFDPFVHLAGMDLIAKTGQLNPKTFYYIGQYFFMVSLNTLTKIPLDTINKFLTPLLVPTLLLPLTYLVLKKIKYSTTVAAVAGVGIIIVPISIFIMTTPYSLAAVLMLGSVLLTMLDLESASWSLSLAALVTHPIPGVAAITNNIFYRSTQITSTRQRHLWLAFGGLVGSLALPTLFLLNNSVSALWVNLNFNPASLLDFKALIFGSSQFIQRYFAIFDLVYFFQFIRVPMIVLGAVCGYKIFKPAKTSNANFLAAATLLGAYVISKMFLNFSFLINYEVSNYADRLVELALLLLLPQFLAYLGQILTKLNSLRLGPRLLTVGTAAVIITMSLYLNYPRRDLYDSSRGWSTSQTDLKTVQSINQEAGANNYVVLSSQPVAAAALKQFGFKKYYSTNQNGPVFFYSIPTGQSLYQKYLAMFDEADTRLITQTVAELTQTKTVYFVVNNYWTNATATIAKAAIQSNKNWNINNTDFIFKYDFTK